MIELFMTKESLEAVSEKDKKRLIHLVNQSVKDSYKEFNHHTKEKWTASQYTDLSAYSTPLFIDRNNLGIITGFMVIYPGTDCLTISSIFVDHPYRNQGIATNLINHLKDKRNPYYHPTIMLDVLDWDIKTKSLYRKLGFSPRYLSMACNVEGSDGS